MKKYYAEIFKGEQRILLISSWDKEETEMKAVAAFKKMLPKGAIRYSDRTDRCGNREIVVAPDLRLVLYR